jgi:hypothetical protein
MTRNSPWKPPYIDPSTDPWDVLCARERDLQMEFAIEQARDWSSQRCALAYNNWRAICQDMDAFFIQHFSDRSIPAPGVLS